MQTTLTDRQVEIIEASGKILMEKGIMGLTTKNLAKEMNFSESALYRHFKDKETIISLLIRFLSDNITTRFEDILQKDITSEEKFIELFQSQFLFFKANPHFIVIVLSDGLLDHSEAIKSEIMKLMHTNALAFKKMIEDCGYFVEYLGFDPVGGGLPKISRFFSIFFPGLFAYQIVIKAKVFPCSKKTTKGSS